MKYVKEALVTYIIFFAFFGLFTYGLPLGFVFIVWDWDIITLDGIMTILRVNAAIAFLVSIWFYIDKAVNQK
jgi:hypothetical protein